MGKKEQTPTPPSPFGTPRFWVLAALLAGLITTLSWTGWVDRSAQEQAQSMLTRALVTYAVARSLNGVISVIQETEVAIQPAGVGVKLAPGEVLDPVNDLIEQFSWVMLASAASLGIQRLMLEISQWPGMTLVLLTSLAIWLAVLIGRPANRWRATAGRVLLLALFLRFAAPCVMLASDAVYQLFLDPVYVEASAQIGQTQSELTDLHQQATEEAQSEEDSGWTGWWGRTADQFRLSERIESYQALFAELTENVVELVAVFVLQTIVLPLLFLWGLLKLWRQLWRWSPE
ncbi:MAG: hypothetical protein AAGJ52_10015 [Pseudomonadota bacterium]